MKRKLLDTSHLIDHWNKKGGKSLTIGGHGILAAATLANELIRFRGTKAIVTPVKIEFLCGVQSSQEMELALEYLKHFQVIDDGRLLPQDWVEVTRLAKRVPRNRKPRHLGDCLVRALANRYGYEVDTPDTEFPR